jgi:hypothetical protein
MAGVIINGKQKCINVLLGLQVLLIHVTQYHSDLYVCILFPSTLVCSLTISFPVVLIAKVTLTGYEGPNCTEDIDECSSDLFLCGEGFCLNIRGNYKCRCPEGKCGSQCADDDPCFVSMRSRTWQLPVH